MLYHTMTVLLECIDLSLQFPQKLNIAIKMYFTLPYYAGIMLNAFNDSLCLKLCWHHRRVCNHYYIIIIIIHDNCVKQFSTIFQACYLVHFISIII